MWLSQYVKNWKSYESEVISLVHSFFVQETFILFASVHRGYKREDNPSFYSFIYNFKTIMEITNS